MHEAVEASSTAGVDLSSQDGKTATCVIRWSDGAARVAALEIGIGDTAIRALLADDGITKTGLDVPFGWPIAFANAVYQHSTNASWPTGYRHADITAFRFRRTDLHVWKQTGLWPLSVSTDRIGIPAMRAAALLSAARAPLDGSGRAVEVYPAVALRQWNLPFRRYKGVSYRNERVALVDRFLDGTSDWLSLPPKYRDLCKHSDDAFDALIAALVARAASRGEVVEVPNEERSAAAREGWIHIPRPGSLSALAGRTLHTASISAVPGRSP